MQTVKKFAKLNCITVSKIPTADVKLAHRRESTKKTYKLFVKDWLCWEGLYGTGLFKINLATTTLSLCPCGSMFIRELILPVVFDETSIFFSTVQVKVWNGKQQYLSSTFKTVTGNTPVTKVNQKQQKMHSEFMWSLF